MSCPSAIRPALMAAAATVTALLLVLFPTLGPALASAPGGAPVVRAAEADPLLVQLDAISPVVPNTGTVDISGTVTNTSDEQWTEVYLLAFRSETPILDSANLAASAVSDPTAYVGARITDAGTYDTVEVLDPGQTAPFAMSVPVELLGINVQAGVYWMGVHARGATESQPRDTFSDGRARTFIPYLPSDSGPLDVAVLLPLRQGLLHGADGRLASTRWWRRALSDGGRLDAVLDTAEAAGETPYTWLVDPAVLAAVNRLTAGNPERSLAPDPTVPGQEPEPVPEAEPTDDESPGTASPDAGPTTTTPPVPESERTEAEQRLAELAIGWLDRARALMTSRSVLALPYGDLDVSAAVRHAPEWLDLATARSTAMMTQLGIPATPAVAPGSGSMSPEAIDALPVGTTILMSDTAFAEPPSGSVVRTLGQRVVVTSSGAESGGPTPGDPHDPLALRQRVLSEGALRLQAGSTALVVTLPLDWRPQSPAQFFDGLERRWLRPVSLLDVANGSAVGVPARSVVYTEEDVEAELSSAHFATARQLTDASALLEKVLLRQTTIEAQVLDETLPALSERHRPRSGAALATTQASLEELRSLLGDITIVTGPAVTLSSDRGHFGFTLVNGLDQPVTVRVDGATDDTITLRGEAVRVLSPDQRVPVRWEAVATTPGIHDVRLVVAAEDGTPLGSAVQLPIRAARVSDLIWYLMAGATALFLGALGLRLWRSVRRARAAQPVAAGSGAEPAPARRDGQRV